MPLWLACTTVDTNTNIKSREAIAESVPRLVSLVTKLMQQQYAAAKLTIQSSDGRKQDYIMPANEVDSCMHTFKCESMRHTTHHGATCTTQYVLLLCPWSYASDTV
jgi:hypothetical protein